MKTEISTIMVAYIVSFLEGQVTFLSSILTSLKNWMIASNRLIVDSPLERIGRPGGIRTPNIRIWSPALYPLELLAYVFGLTFPVSGIPEMIQRGDALNALGVEVNGTVDALA
jgi:hypothetical protein